MYKEDNEKIVKEKEICEKIAGELMPFYGVKNGKALRKSIMIPQKNSGMNIGGLQYDKNILSGCLHLSEWHAGKPAPGLEQAEKRAVRIISK